MKKMAFIVLVATVAAHASDAPKSDDAKLQALTIVADTVGQTDSDAKKVKLTEAATNAASALPIGYDELQGACVCSVVAQDTTEQPTAFSKAPARVATLNYKDVFGDSSDSEEDPIFSGSDDEEDLEDGMWRRLQAGSNRVLSTSVLQASSDNNDESSPTFSIPNAQNSYVGTFNDSLTTTYMANCPSSSSEDNGVAKK